jgi:hypothetical protein
MKSKQFCSVCKEWLDMEVVPTGDGDEDDGVIWFRCPQCQGFLPKLSGADLQDERDATPAGTATDPGEPGSDSGAEPAAGAAEDMPWDSPADMMAARRAAAEVGEDHDPEAPQDADALPEGIFPPPGLEETSPDSDDDSVDTAGGGDADEDSPPPSEPVHEYAAMLAELDPSSATPYRPWETYEVGECVHHLAWDDCGVVVAKEDLPGGRKVIKCYFEDAGVVRLIEQAAP